MREFFYLDTPTNQVIFSIWAVMLATLLFKEVLYLRKDGWKQYFFGGQAGFWNVFELLFFSQIWGLLRALQKYWYSSLEVLEVLEDTRRWRNTDEMDPYATLPFLDLPLPSSLPFLDFSLPFTAFRYVGIYSEYAYTDLVEYEKDYRSAMRQVRSNSPVR